MSDVWWSPARVGISEEMLQLMQLYSSRTLLTLKHKNLSLLAGPNTTGTSAVPNPTHSWCLCRHSWCFLCLHPCSLCTVPAWCRVARDPFSSNSRIWGYVGTLSLHYISFSFRAGNNAVSAARRCVAPPIRMWWQCAHRSGCLVFSFLSSPCSCRACYCFCMLFSPCSGFLVVYFMAVLLYFSCRYSATQ